MQDRIQRATRPTFCTLFNIGNEHLTKDVGLIPYGMSKFQGYNSFIATYINGDYLNLKHIPGLKIEEVPGIFKNWLMDSCKWLIKNARKIDVLNIYHVSGTIFLYALIYKIFNRNGKIYLKLDGVPPIKRYKMLRRVISLLQVKLCYCISTELPENAARLSQEWKRRVIYVPNPFNPNEIRDYNPFSERQNVIFYSGRIEKEKGSHTLLEAFARISSQIPDWELKLAGSITDKSITDEFANKYPDLSKRVIFTGEIRDREELIKLYREAKIFAFPSRHESFGIALSEAMSHGCFAVTSDIFSSRSLTENFRFGLASKVDDVQGLADNLLYACTHESEIESLAIEGREATLKRCNIENICRSIAEGLK